MNSPSAQSEISTEATPFRQVRRLGLHRVGGAVGRARDFTVDVLGEWGWTGSGGIDSEAGEWTEDILLVVSELVGNAMAHGGGVQELALTAEGRTLTVAVTDFEAAVPVPAPSGDPARPGGHGLHVVGLLSRNWGTVHNASGKTVWAEFGW